MRDPGSSLWALSVCSSLHRRERRALEKFPAVSAATWRYGLGGRALELRSQAHELREDLAPKAQSLQCLSQRQRFLPVSPVDGHLGAPSAGWIFY